jgi:tRNA (uracil-5-)-methyltransferase
MLKPLLTTTDPQNYDLYFNEKITEVKNLFIKAGLDIPPAKLYKSPAEYYRMRAEFAVFHEYDGNISFIMFKPNTDPKERIVVEHFPIASHAINKGMELLRTYVKDNYELKKKLFEAEFLCNQNGDLIISLSYHRPLDASAWKEAALKLKEQCLQEGLNVDFIGRARKQKILANTDTILETIHTQDKDFYLYQVEGNFSQPNIYTCQHMIDFARSLCRNKKDVDLIELYCGSGTFTVCLADLFRQALSTEVSRVPTATALKNIEKNQIVNTKIVRLSAVEVAEALTGVREFKRLQQEQIDINSYNFDTLLIDPPRSGLEFQEARDFTAKFDHVIYVSCGPQSLVEDLSYLCKTHEIHALAFFDQFPYTPHLETIVELCRK